MQKICDVGYHQTTEQVERELQQKVSNDVLQEVENFSDRPTLPELKNQSWAEPIVNYLISKGMSNNDRLAVRACVEHFFARGKKRREACSQVHDFFAGPFKKLKTTLQKKEELMEIIRSYYERRDTMTALSIPEDFRKATDDQLREWIIQIDGLNMHSYPVQTGQEVSKIHDWSHCALEEADREYIRELMENADRAFKEYLPKARKMLTLREDLALVFLF